LSWIDNFWRLVRINLLSQWSVYFIVLFNMERWVLFLWTALSQCSACLLQCRFFECVLLRCRSISGESRI